MEQSLGKFCPGGSLKTWDGAAGLMQTVKSIGNELEGITARAEAEFLSIGEMLFDFHGRAVRISEISAGVAGRMTGLEIVSSIDALNGLMEKMESYLGCFGSGSMARLEQLAEILGLINVMYESLDNFRRHARNFRAIAITARIHNALLIAGNDSLRVLLDGVKELSGMIAERVESIMDGVSAVRDMVENGLSELRLFEEEQQAKSRPILDSTSSILCAITEKYGFSTTLVRNVADRSCDITELTGKIVTSVQFHDITSQQLQGVKRALVELYETSLSISDGQFCASRNNNMTPVTGVVDCCRQQSFNLACIRDTFAAAVNGIKDNLAHISGNIEAITADTRRILGQRGSAGGGSFLSDMKDMLTSMTVSFNSLTDHAMTNRGLSSTFLYIASSTIEMSRFISGIEEVTDDMQLIALNAEIKASQSGQEGAAFGVVAGRIQGLAAESCNYMEIISDGLRKITALSEKLSSEITLQLDSAGNELEVISGEIGKIIYCLSEVNGNICAGLTDIDESGRMLAADIEHFTKRLGVHTMVETVVDTVAAELTRIADYPGLRHGGDRGNGSKWHGLTVEYRPEFSGGPEWGPVPSFGLLDAEVRPLKADRQADAGGQMPENFGDNIELFE